eukprot:50205-Hanusia_phi.AAC.1
MNTKDEREIQEEGREERGVWEESCYKGGGKGGYKRRGGRRGEYWKRVATREEGRVDTGGGGKIKQRNAPGRMRRKDEKEEDGGEKGRAPAQ